MERDCYTCQVCGASPAGHVGHLVSVKDASTFDMADIVNDDVNLIAQCDECNLGQGSLSYAPSFIARVVKLHHRKGAA
jgi:5-methylcytosine-specific restriction endonuclease McrA